MQTTESKKIMNMIIEYVIISILCKWWDARYLKTTKVTQQWTVLEVMMTAHTETHLTLISLERAETTILSVIAIYYICLRLHRK